MTDGEIRALIRREIREALTPIMMGFIESNESVQRSTIRRMSMEGAITNVRSIQPFGFSSKAPPKTEGLMIPVNGDATHINMVGHFDKDKPSVQTDGESLMYDSFGHMVYLSEAMMQFGSKNSANPMMLGDIVQELFSTMLELISNHVHIGNLGYPVGAMSTKSELVQLKASPIDDGAIISDKCFTEK